MRIFLRILTIMVLSAATATAQTLCSSLPTNRNVVLEEFTGVRCVYCPEGHAIAQSILNKFPYRTVVINIHSGTFAEPMPGYPNYTTQFGDSIRMNANGFFYPSASLNRMELSILRMALERYEWETYAGYVREMTSPVNLGVKSNFDPATRKLTVTVEAFYTADSPSPSGKNFLHVALLENKVIGYQSGGVYNYSHNHMLRWLLTGQWGVDIAPMKKGTLITKTFTYTVPANFNIANCDVSAFVSQFPNSEVYTGENVPADGGTTQPPVSLSNYVKLYKAGSAGQAVLFDLTTSSALTTAAQQARVSIESDAPADWKVSGTAGFMPAVEFTTTKPGDYTIPGGSSAAVQLNIVPGATAAIVKIRATFESLTMPGSRKSVKEFYVMSGVKDLIVSHPDAVKFDTNYKNGIASTGKADFTATTQEIFSQFSKNDALSGIKNLYFNVSWAFPGVNDELVTEISKAMNNGMNAMFAGQDLGWDIASMDSNAHGTALQRLFYKNFMHAKFIADGGGDNASVSAVSKDQVFGTSPAFKVADAYSYGYYLQPDIIEPASGGQAIFRYNNDDTKIGGIRAETPQYKMVYLGFGIEQINNPFTANRIMKATSDWFDGIICGDKLGAEILAIPPPNQVNRTITLTAPLSATDLLIYDPTGKVILAQSVIAGDMVINSDGYAAGVYKFNYSNSSGSLLKTGSFVIPCYCVHK